MLETFKAYRLFLFDDKLLASNTDVALITPEVSQVPTFVHSDGVFPSKDQLRNKRKTLARNPVNMLVS